LIIWEKSAKSRAEGVTGANGGLRADGSGARESNEVCGGGFKLSAPGRSGEGTRKDEMRTEEHAGISKKSAGVMHMRMLKGGGRCKIENWTFGVGGVKNRREKVARAP